MKRKRILLAEDNPINQKIAMIMLKKFDQVIDLAENGSIAVEKFKTGVYDLVLMDIHMPELDGFEATRIIREFEKKQNRGARTKIFAMTASSPQDERDNCFEAGMDGYLTKPFNKEELTALLLD
jgi:CheY-like chemotaxis protein